MSIDTSPILHMYGDLEPKHQGLDIAYRLKMAQEHVQRLCIDALYVSAEGNHGQHCLLHDTH
jgi:hypothetical protein